MKPTSNKPNGSTANNRLMNMESKEKWINDVIASGTDTPPLSHHPFLHRKTLYAMEKRTIKNSKRWTVSLMTSVAFLIILNGFMLFNYKQTSVFEDADITIIMNEYTLNAHEISLYNF